MQAVRLLCAMTFVIAVGTSGGPAAAQSPVETNEVERQLVKAPPGFLASCGRLPWLCGALVADGSMTDPAEVLALAHRINRRVNSTVAEMSDPQNYGAADYWTLPANGRGDCEDFALLKYRLLLDAGVSDRDLSIAVVLDQRGENHAVLVLRHGSADLVLDSRSREILPWNQTDYRFLAMQTPDEKAQWEIVTGRSKRSSILASR
jgi:predicted transglutaminase-like cysteine proteinase